MTGQWGEDVGELNSYVIVNLKKEKGKKQKESEAVQSGPGRKVGRPMTMFCQQVANNPSMDWSQMNNSLYSVTFMAHQKWRGRICEHCLETDHAAGDCALAPYRPNRPSLKEVPKEESQSTKQVERAESRERVCYPCNDGRCPLPYCRYWHICARCHSAQ